MGTAASLERAFVVLDSSIRHPFLPRRVQQGPVLPALHCHFVFGTAAGALRTVAGFVIIARTRGTHSLTLSISFRHGEILFV
jgi:hypothetical protein